MLFYSLHIQIYQNYIIYNNKTKTKIPPSANPSPSHAYPTTTNKYAYYKNCIMA